MTRMDAASELNCLFCCYFVLFLFALHSVDCFVCDINFHHNWMYVKRPTNRVTQMNRCARSTPLPVQEKNNDINNKNKWLPLLLTLRCLCKHISFFVANNFYESLRARARECMCTDFSLFVAHFSPSLGHGLHLRCQLAQWNFKWMCFSWTVFSEWRRTYKIHTHEITLRLVLAFIVHYSRSAAQYKRNKSKCQAHTERTRSKAIRVFYQNIHKNKNYRSFSSKRFNLF